MTDLELKGIAHDETADRLNALLLKVAAHMWTPSKNTLDRELLEGQIETMLTHVWGDRGAYDFDPQNSREWELVELASIMKNVWHGVTFKTMDEEEVERHNQSIRDLVDYIIDVFGEVAE